MRSYQQAFGAGESKDFIIDAKYFFLFDANSAVNIQFWKGGAPSDDLALNILSGFKCRPEKGFDRITITSSAAQTISFFVTKGEGDYDRFIGNVNILGSLAGITNTVNTVNAGQSYGASYRANNTLAANTAETIITPGSNVNGAIIHSAQFFDSNAASNAALHSVMLAKSSAPANTTDGDPILGHDMFYYNGTASYVCGSLKNPIRIAAGKGLYFITNIASSTSNRSVLYTLL